MHRRQIRFLALSAIVASALSTRPAAAEPPDRDGGRDRGFPGIERVVKRISKLVLRALDELTLPHP